MYLQSGFNTSVSGSPGPNLVIIPTTNNTTRIYTRIALSISSTRGQANTPTSFPYVLANGGQTPTANLQILDGFENLMVEYTREWVLAGDDQVLIDRKTPLVVPEFSRIRINSNTGFFVNYTYQLVY